MTHRTRYPLAVLLASCALWLGCDKPDPEPLDAGTPSQDAGGQGADGGTEPDAGEPEPWDGGAVALEELGEPIEAGPLSACTILRTDDAGTPLACGSPESFDLSQCNRDTLAQLSPEGRYGLLTRFGPGNFSANSFTLSSDSSLESVAGYPLSAKTLDGQSFYVSGLRTLADGGTTLYAYAGCEAQGAERFNGCYQTCTNGGARRSGGTFDGVRLQRLTEPEASGLALVGEARVENLGHAVDVYVHKNHAYVVSLTLGRAAEPKGGLSVFDVSDRAHPVLRKKVTLEGDTDWNAVWAVGDALYVGSARHGVLVFDITHPADPVMLRGVPGDSFDVHTLYADGDRLYAQAAGADQLLFFDIRAPLNPVLLGRHTIPALDNGDDGYCHDAFAYGDRLYVNQMGQGYTVLDVKDPGNVKQLGAYVYDSPLYKATHANAVGTFAGRTIAFEGGEGPAAHLRVLDVTDPAHIVKIGEVRLREQTSIHNLVLVGKRLYVAWYVEGLRVFDVSNPTQPKQVAHYNTFRDWDEGRTDKLFEGAYSVRVPGDGYVYVAESTRGLVILREQ